MTLGFHHLHLPLISTNQEKKKKKGKKVVAEYAVIWWAQWTQYSKSII